jgi:hypothetical protein
MRKIVRDEEAAGSNPASPTTPMDICHVCILHGEQAGKRSADSTTPRKIVAAHSEKRP